MKPRVVSMSSVGRGRRHAIGPSLPREPSSRRPLNRTTAKRLILELVLAPSVAIRQPNPRWRQACRASDNSATKFELIVNLTPAMAPGLKIADLFLRLADKVIE